MGQYTSYYLYEKYERRCSGNSDGDCSDWIPSYPNVFSKDGDGSMPLVVRIENDYDCGYTCPVEYDWRELPIDQVYQCDECETPVNVTHKWEDNGGFVCEGTTKYQALQLYSNSGNGWEATVPTIIKPGNVIEEKSLDCGYQRPRLKATLADGTVKELKLSYIDPDTNHLDASEIIGGGIPISQIKNAEFYGDFINCGIFAGCQTLSSITFHKDEEISAFAFFGTGVRSVSGTIGSISDYSFANCKSLTSFTDTSVNVHDGINGEGAFANCTGLTEIDLSKLRIHGNSSYDGGGGGADCLFLGCTNLGTAKINIGDYARIPRSCFESCTSLRNVEINTDEVLPYRPGVGTYGYTIGERAFFNCSNLSGLTETTQSYISSIGMFSFAGCEKLPESEFENKFGVPSGVTTYSYPSGAFVDCKLFTHMPVPKLTYSGEVYSNVNEEAVIPLTGDCSLTSVGAYAFSGCTGLQGGLEFDEYLDSIGAHAFDGCTGITSVTIENETPPSLGDGAFDNTSNCPIYVPAGSVETYKSAAGWSEYASRIQ